MDNLRETLKSNKKYQKTAITFTSHSTRVSAIPSITLIESGNEEVRVLRTKPSLVKTQAIQIFKCFKQR